MLKRFLVWILILLVGAFLIGIAQPQFSSMAGSGAGTGMFEHHFQAKINFPPDPESDDRLMGSIFIEADHPQTFMLSGHNSPKYERARFKWYIFRENESSGETWIDLNRMSLTHKGRSIQVNVKNLLKLFGYDSATQEDLSYLESFVSLISAANNGELPPPRHHTYQLEDPLDGYLQHVASGWSVPILTLIWIMFWSMVGCFGLWKFQKERRVQQRPNQSP